MPDVGRFFNIDPLSEKYSYQSHYNFSENRVIDGRELEGLEWSKSTDGKSIHNHAVIRNQSSYKGNLVPIVERMKSDFEKAYSVNGVKATYSYEFNENADSSKQFVTSLSDPISKTSVPIKDEKGRIKGFTTSMIGGLAFTDSPIINDIKVVITTNSNGDLADLEQIGQRSVHELGHSGGLPHSWEKNSTVPLEKEIQEANAMNSSAQESPFPVPGGTNITITPKQIEKIINNPKIPVE